MARDHGSSVKDDKQYEGLRKKGMSKQRDGDSDLAEFFRRAQEASRRGAEQGTDLLKNRLAG